MEKNNDDFLPKDYEEKKINMHWQEPVDEKRYAVSEKKLKDFNTLTQKEHGKLFTR